VACIIRRESEGVQDAPNAGVADSEVGMDVLFTDMELGNDLSRGGVDSHAHL
jgi:hypothetical protein